MALEKNCDWRNQAELSDIRLDELLPSDKPDPLGLVSVQRQLVTGNPLLELNNTFKSRSHVQ